MRASTDNTDQIELLPEGSLVRRMPKPALAAGAVVSILVAAGTTMNYMLAGGSNPSRLLNFVASGLVGNDAFGGEADSAAHMALLGAILHVLVSVGWSFLLFAFSMKFPRFLRSWGFLGMAFGVLIWAAMVFVVMPLSRTPSLELDPKAALIDIVILILGAGLPISFLAHRFRTKNVRHSGTTTP